MKKAIVDTHKIHNVLTRLRSIVECVEQEGEGFVTAQVTRDIEESIAIINFEFKKIVEETEDEN